METTNWREWFSILNHFSFRLSFGSQRDFLISCDRGKEVATDRIYQSWWKTGLKENKKKIMWFLVTEEEERLNDRPTVFLFCLKKAVGLLFLSSFSFREKDMSPFLPLFICLDTSLGPDDRNSSCLQERQSVLSQVFVFLPFLFKSREDEILNMCLCLPILLRVSYSVWF